MLSMKYKTSCARLSFFGLQGCEGVVNGNIPERSRPFDIDKLTKGYLVETFSISM